MTLKAIWSRGALLHDPAGEVWIGLPLQGDETAARGEAFKKAIDAAGLDVVGPQPHPDGAITAVHDPGMLDYLRGAYEEWTAAGYPDEPGQRYVVAYAFRHPGAFDHVPRHAPKSRAAMAGVYCFDTCTALGPGSYSGIRYAVDASLTAADLILTNPGMVYAGVRPPGHHAGTDYFGGSCYLNNAAITARYLVDSTEARVGIVDIDAHHGNGTQQVFFESDNVFYGSVHIDPGEGWFPHWSGFADEVGTGRGLVFNRNIPLPTGAGDDEFVAAVETLTATVDVRGCELLVVSMGVDAGVNDENSPLNVTTSGFERAAEVLAAPGLPAVLIQEGGYHLPSLERDLTAILTRLAGAGDG